MRTSAYATFFENINSNTPLKEYEKVFDRNAKFKDPFHNVVGLDKIYKIFEDMYLKLDNPKFKIIEIVEQNSISYIRWDFEFAFKNSSNIESFEGVSKVEFNEEGKVISHIDYWDSSSCLYEKIPILSSFMRFIKRKIKS